MPEFVPRSLVILAGFIAAIALFIGIRDYISAKNEVRPVASGDAQSVVQPKATPLRKKANTKKARRARISATDANAAVAGAAESAAEKPFIGAVLASLNTAYEPRKPAKLQSPLDEVNATSSVRSCVPLPNSTKPEDVDAIYYQGWAREYGCGRN